jgi:N-methylhydantoinase B/oxoprolinase/acetone carboxylase alpha subunit
MWSYVKGGGPYGSEVTRGQDLTGKDFSDRTLIKQDFKTVYDLVSFFFLLFLFVCSKFNEFVIG